MFNKYTLYKMKSALSLFFLMILATVAKPQAEKYDSIINKYQAQSNFNGVVLVATGGNIDYYKAAGLANRDMQLPMEVNAKFKIASVSKLFTAVLIIKLVGEGRINLDKNIGDYYQAYKGEGRNKVTIHQLLTYSSGIENIIEPLGMKAYQTITPIDKFIDTYCSGKLVDTPGTKSIYSNTEYIILHKIIEQVSGKSYGKYLNEVIIKPLKLANTGICLQGKKIDGLVQAYTYDDSLKTFTPDEPYYPQMFFGAGFLYSTAQDLLIFNEAIFSGKLLGNKLTEKMITINNNLGYTAYGLWGSTGWGNFDEKFYYRTGGILGSTANWIHTVNTNKTIIVLSNTSATNLYELSEKLYLAAKHK